MILSVSSAGRLAREKPFLGVPMSVKDLYFVRGLFTTAGLWWRRRAVAYEDAEAVAALKARSLPDHRINIKG